MLLSKKQKQVINSIENLLSIRIEASACKRNVIVVEVKDARYCSESKFYTLIESTCKKYKLGRVESNGANHLAIII